MLQILRRVEDLRAVVAAWRRQGLSIGLIPTMGALHRGHLRLMERALADCDRAIATIFVNPLQFNRSNDLDNYPRREQDDASKLAAAGVHLLFSPTPDVMYPDGFATRVTVPGLSDCLCGATRPGHMTGVATVVTKLFLQALPDRAYFGEKDFQQLLIVRRMSRDLDMPLDVVGVETVREEDGLALSSRNIHLDDTQRRIAPALYEVMRWATGEIAAGAEIAAITHEGLSRLEAAGFDGVDYLEVRAEQDLSALDDLDGAGEGPARVFAAAWLGSTRLIDNLAVPSAVKTQRRLTG